MSTTHLTSDDNLLSYTAVGGTERGASTGLSAVVLNRGGRYPRFGLFEELEKAGFDYVICMETSSARGDLETLTQSFPFVRFIILKEALSPGEEINLAAAELSGPLFFVLWNDLKILRSGGAERMAERLLSGAGSGAAIGGDNSGAGAGGNSLFKRLCTAPLIQDSRADTLPSRIVPALLPQESFFPRQGASIKTLHLVPEKEGLPSLYPFDGIGIYDRERFIRLGGFDPSIKSFYWQLMDFGFRSFLWGEEIASTQLIKVSYEGAVPPEDSTVNKSAFWFYLKNLAPVFRGDYAHIPLSRFPGYRKKRGELFSAWKEFTAVRDWVKINRYRFSSDARTVAERFTEDNL